MNQTKLVLILPLDGPGHWKNQIAEPKKVAHKEANPRYPSNKEYGKPGCKPVCRCYKKKI